MSLYPTLTIQESSRLKRSANHLWNNSDVCRKKFGEWSPLISQQIRKLIPGTALEFFKQEGALQFFSSGGYKPILSSRFFSDCRYRFYLKLGKKLHVAMHSQGSEINSQTQSFDAYRNSFLRVISVIIEIINYPFKLGKMRFNRPFFFNFRTPPPSIFSPRCARRIAPLEKRPKLRHWMYVIVLYGLKMCNEYNI